MAAFRRGVMIGFAIGYVQGSKAGRDRYEQINKAWKAVKETPAYQRFSSQVGAVVGFGVQRGKLVALDAVAKASQKIKNPAARNGHKDGS